MQWWNTISSVLVGATVIVPILVFWVKKVRGVVKNDKLANILDQYVLPILAQGQQVAEATKNQEVKIKQFGEIIFDSLPDKGASINDKYAVKLANLQKDVESAVKGTVVYDEKLKALEALVDEIKGGIVPK